MTTVLINEKSRKKILYMKLLKPELKNLKFSNFILMRMNV